MRERRIGKLMAPASKHRAASRPEHARANYASRHLHSGRGAGCRNFSRLPARGRAFSLDILFYRTEGWANRKELQARHLPRQSYLAHHIRKARVRAQAIEDRIDVQVNQPDRAVAH